MLLLACLVCCWTGVQINQKSDFAAGTLLKCCIHYHCGLILIKIIAQTQARLRADVTF